MSMRMKAYNEEGLTVVKALIKHPMERPSTNEEGKETPGHFIQEVIFEHGGQQVMSALLSGGVSKNPFLAFKFKGGADGDMVKLTWTDNQGGTGTKEVKIG